MKTGWASPCGWSKLASARVANGAYELVLSGGSGLAVSKRRRLVAVLCGASASRKLPSFNADTGGLGGDSVWVNDPVRGSVLGFGGGAEQS